MGRCSFEVRGVVRWVRVLREEILDALLLRDLASLRFELKK